jgi:hypothetical protein
MFYNRSIFSNIKQHMVGFTERKFAMLYVSHKWKTNNSRYADDTLSSIVYMNRLKFNVVSFFLYTFNTTVHKNQFYD